MAKANHAKDLADMPVGDDDPISELSDIMKFDPIEVVLEQTGQDLQLDLEHELMGDLAEIDTDTLADDEIPPEPGAEAANDIDADELVDPDSEDLDDTFGGLFDQSLDDDGGDEAAAPSVPHELESQLNELLAGLGTSSPREAEAVEPLAADDAEDETYLAASDDVPVLEDEDWQLTDDDDGLDVEKEKTSDPLSTLAEIVGDFGSGATKSAEVPEDEESDPAPVIETADIVDEAVTLEDDLDIPDVAFETEVPKTPDFDDLDAEFSHAFNKLTEYDKVKDEDFSETFSAVVGEAEPHLSEKIDDIFAEMSQTAGAATSAFDAHRRTNGAMSDRDMDWVSDFPSARDESDHDYPESTIPAGIAGTAAAQSSEGGGARRGILIAMIVAAIAAAGGIGAFALSFGSGDETAAPALVKADDGPVKVKPKDPGGKTVPNEDKKVYERVAGNGETETPTQEKLISTNEEPVDVAIKTPEPRVIVPNPVESPEPAVVAKVEPEPAVKNDDRIAPEIEGTGAETPAEIVAVKPRRVKTLIVKPDGTLVPREELEPVATTELRASTAETDGATTGSEKMTGNGETASETAGGSEVAAVATDEQSGAQDREVTFQSPAADEAVVVDGGSKPAEEGVVVEGIPVPTPAPRAEFKAAMAAAEAEKQRSQPAESELKPAEAVTPEKTKPVVAAVEPAPAETAEWWVQISSQPSRESAQASYAELASRYGSIIGGHGVNIVRADIEGKGTYYRVRIAGGSRNDAAQLCSRLKSAGANCFIAK